MGGVTNIEELRKCEKVFVGIYLIGIVIGFFTINKYVTGDGEYSSYTMLDKCFFVLSINIFLASLLGVVSIVIQSILGLFDNGMFLVIVLIIIDCLFWGKDCLCIIEDVSKLMLIINIIITCIVFYILFYSVENIKLAIYLLKEIEEYEIKYTDGLEKLNNTITEYNFNQDAIKELIKKYMPELDLKEKITQFFKGEGFRSIECVVFNEECKLNYDVHSIILFYGWGMSYFIRAKYKECVDKLMELTTAHEKFSEELRIRNEYYKAILQSLDNINKYDNSIELKIELEKSLKLLLNDAKKYRYIKVNI